MKILFLVRSLQHGGAERQLTLLSKGLHERGHQIMVVTFYGGGAMEGELRTAGVTVRDLAKRGRWDMLGPIYRLMALMRKEQPDIVHSYLVEPNIVGTILKPIISRTRVVWGVRASMMHLEQYDWFVRGCFRLSCMLSHFADLILVNSKAGRAYHVQQGYPADRMITIQNGIDVERFKPDPNGRIRVRREWGIGDEEILIGYVARLDPIKDHPTFIHAAAELAKGSQQVRFACVGDGPADYRERLQSIARGLGLGERVIWAGLRQDMSAVYSSLDVACSTSIGEGFPNAICEAMACGIPCVVTDVGDCARIVGMTGAIVPARDPVALASALNTVLNTPCLSPHKIRQQILDLASTDSLVKNTEAAFMSLLSYPLLQPPPQPTKSILP